MEKMNLQSSEPQSWEERLFVKIVGVPLNTKPINGRIIAEEMGLFDALQDFDALVSFFASELSRREAEVREEIVKEVLSIATKLRVKAKPFIGRYNIALSDLSLAL